MGAGLPSPVADLPAGAVAASLGAWLLCELALSRRVPLGCSALRLARLIDALLADSSPSCGEGADRRRTASSLLGHADARVAPRPAVEAGEEGQGGQGAKEGKEGEVWLFTPDGRGAPISREAGAFLAHLGAGHSRKRRAHVPSAPHFNSNVPLDSQQLGALIFFLPLPLSLPLPLPISFSLSLSLSFSLSLSLPAAVIRFSKA
ncbi:hypothetical protein T492DRAFT_266257 [Pavlovales sp. CCMP2436]|nr:hypothetical protein T492DRAFT_266257 [Pavlovales sp. CCMP2436]